MDPVDSPSCPPAAVVVVSVVADAADAAEATDAEALTVLLIPVLLLPSLVTEVGDVVAVSGRAIVGATDEEVVGGRIVEKLDVSSTSTQSRS